MNFTNAKIQVSANKHCRLSRQVYINGRQDEIMSLCCHAASLMSLDKIVFFKKNLLIVHHEGPYTLFLSTLKNIMFGHWTVSRKSSLFIQWKSEISALFNKLIWWFTNKLNKTENIILEWILAQCFVSHSVLCTGSFCRHRWNSVK